MGGLVCAIRRNAILRFEEVPNKPKDIVKFDEQMRALFTAPSIAEAVEADTTRGQEVCDILSKHEFSHADRVALLGVVESLYETDE